MMRIRLFVIISLCWITAVVLPAQDSLRLHPDTFRLQELPSTVGDLWLLDLVERNYKARFSDSIQREVVISAMRLDSLLHDSIMLDSLKRVYSVPAIAHTQVEGIAIEKSLIKDAEEDRADVLRAIRDKRTPWRKDIYVMAQMTQNYATPNWYQGGNASFAMLALAKGTINYYKGPISWENTGEWRMGWSTISGDSLHKINTTDDLLRLYSKFGYEFYKHLFAIGSVEFETRFFPTYKSNSNKLATGPFSPVRLNLEIGLDWRPVKNLSIVISPLSYKMIHVHDTIRMQQTDFGVPEGKMTLNDAGSTLRINYTWKPVREISLDGRFYLYTNYSRVEIDLELNCDFIINRFLSTRVTLHPRYDNTVIYKDDSRAHVQFKEIVSVGFAHKFH